jgi:nucleotide-binding universal stress UspA family protein
VSLAGVRGLVGAARRVAAGRAGGVLLGSQPDRRPLTILAAVDGSPASSAAVEAAIRVAGLLAGSIVFVHAGDGGAEDPGLADAVARATAAGVAATAEHVEGEPSAAIVEAAAAHDAGLVVLGSRGRGPVAGAVLGTVSKAVLDTIDRPLLIVRKP